MKTIKQIANELGVSKQRVYRYVKMNHIKMVQEGESLFLFDEAGEMLIKQHFSQNAASKSFQDEMVKDEVFLLFESQLEFMDEQIKSKDKLIDSLTNQLKETTSALVSAQQMASAAQALHAGTIQAHLIETNDESNGHKTNPFRRFFQNRKK